MYRQQQAATRYTELAESFTNTVYEQSDSLQPAVSKFSLELKKAEGVTRNPGPAVPPDSPLRNPRLLGLLFGEDALRNKRNTEAMEVSPGVLVSARVVQHHPAKRQPLEEVKDQVRARVVAAEAARRAKEEGEKLLACARRPTRPKTRPNLRASSAHVRDAPSPAHLRESWRRRSSTECSSCRPNRCLPLPASTSVRAASSWSGWRRRSGPDADRGRAPPDLSAAGRAGAGPDRGLRPMWRR